MTYKIEEIEGIGPAYGEKFQAAGIASTDDLLKHCGTPAGRKQISEKTGMAEGQILKFTNMADLMRISGVGRQYAELLEAAGVDTIKELRNRNAENLTKAMEQVNLEKKLARTTPAMTIVHEWVEAAKTTEPKITY